MAKKNKNILLLGLVSFFNDISSEMLAPILPILIKQLGGGGLVIGLIGGLREGIGSITKIIFGYLSDKAAKRKIFVYTGYITSSLFKACLYLATTWYQVLGIIGLERLGKGIRTGPRDTLIAYSNPKKKGLGFGIHRTFDTTGAVLGSLLAYTLSRVYMHGTHSIIIIAAGLALLALIPLFFVTESYEIESSSSKEAIALNFSQLSKPLKRYLVIQTIFYLANINYMFLLLQTQNILKGGSLFDPILLYAIFNCFYAASSVPIGMLSDKKGRWHCLFLGYSLSLVTFMGFTITSNRYLPILLFMSYGIATAAIKVTQKAFVADLAPSNHKATLLGTFSAVRGLSTIAGSIIAGFLWQSFSPQTTFAAASTMVCISTLLLLCFKKDFVIESR